MPFAPGIGGPSSALPALHFSRSLAMSVGMALASSCLGMIAGMAARAGWWLLPAIGLSLSIALAVAGAIGRLARRFPSALGVRTYVKAAFGNGASLFVVGLYLVMIVAVASVESQLFAAIAQQVVPGLDARWTVIGVFAVVFAINVLGHEASRNAQLVLVAVMLSGLLALSVCGIVDGIDGSAGAAATVAGAAGVATFGAAAADAGTPAWTAGLLTSQLHAWPTVAVTAFFLFVGFEWVTSSQPASRQAAAQLPRVLKVSIGVLGGVYIAFAAAALLQLDAAALSATRTPQLLMAGRLWGEPGRWAMLLVATAAVLMAFNAGVLGASRLVYSLAREGCLPRWLARADNRRAVPLPAIAATVLVAFVCSAVAGLLDAGDVLGGMAAVLVCICYAALLAASSTLSRRDTAGRARSSATERAALVAITLLLLAMLLDPAAWRATAGAALACAACAIAARAGAQRQVRAGAATASAATASSLTRRAA